MSPPRARSNPPPPLRRPAPVYRDLRVYYAPADGEAAAATEGERRQLQRRALGEAGRTAAEIAARLTRRHPWPAPSCGWP
jgi:hypothetical protein